MILCALILAVALHQEPQTQHLTPEQRIEADLGARLDQSEFQTTAGTDKAYGMAIHAYKEEIDRVYHKLLKGLPPAESASLKVSQSMWKRYEAAELNSIRLIDRRDGTIHQNLSSRALKEVYRHRLEELNARFELSEDEDDLESLPEPASQPITLDQWKKDHDRHRRPRLQPR